MGPPLKAAENLLDLMPRECQQDGFNGAAAKSSGKFGYTEWNEYEPCEASMGPPLKAAENADCEAACHRGQVGFNGAAAKSSGKWFER